jgi:hypothetical protein
MVPQRREFEVRLGLTCEENVDYGTVVLVGVSVYVGPAISEVIGQGRSRVKSWGWRDRGLDWKSM